MEPSKLFEFWPVVPFGGEDGEGEGSEGDGSQDNSGSGGSGGDGAGKAGGKAGKAGATQDDSEDDDEYAGYTVEELKRIAKDEAKKAKDAKASAKDLQAKQDAEERKKNDDVTNLTKDLEKERTSVAALRATVIKQAIEGQIRDDPRYEFHDVEMVASLAVKINADITVSDEGKVEGLKATLPKVAKQHPFLVKTDKTEDGKNKNNNGTQQNNGNGPTGFQPGQGGTSGGSGNEADTKKLAENYPALAARI